MALVLLLQEAIVLEHIRHLHVQQHRHAHLQHIAHQAEVHLRHRVQLVVEAEVADHLVLRVQAAEVLVDVDNTDNIKRINI